LERQRQEDREFKIRLEYRNETLPQKKKNQEVKRS
jgi:hypothetical protein